jgi:hypothetical protein
MAFNLFADRRIVRRSWAALHDDEGRVVSWTDLDRIRSSEREQLFAARCPQWVTLASNNRMPTSRQIVFLRIEFSEVPDAWTMGDRNLERFFPGMTPTSLEVGVSRAAFYTKPHWRDRGSGMELDITDPVIWLRCKELALPAQFAVHRFVMNAYCRASMHPFQRDEPYQTLLRQNHRQKGR